MTNHNVNKGDTGVGVITLTANTEETVTFIDNENDCEIIYDATAADIWLTIDGTAATVPAAGASTRCFRLPMGTSGGFTVAFSGTLGRAEGDGTNPTVRFISAGTPTVSVQKLNA